MNTVIEEYTPKDRSGFYMPVVPWKWTVYDGLNILGFGYTHTEEDAKKMANETMKARQGQSIV